jgi:hypothetical protein
MISMRDGLIDETRLTGGTGRSRRAGRAGGVMSGVRLWSPGRRDLRHRPGRRSDAAGDLAATTTLTLGLALPGDQPAVPADPRGDQRTGRGGLHRPAAGVDPGGKLARDPSGDGLPSGPFPLAGALVRATAWLGARPRTG